MHPILRLVLAGAGALLGAALASGGLSLIAALLGALAGLGLAEGLYLRGALAKVSSELSELRRALNRARAERPAPAADTARERYEERSTFAPARAAAPSPLYAPAAPSPAAPAPGAAPVPAAAPAHASLAASASAEEQFAASESGLVRLLKDYFTGGNALVRGGIIVLFFGVAFLLRYLAEHTHVPIELRLSGVAVGALVLLVIGWRLRERRRGYGLALQGGAVGILYLTVFSALRLYSLLTPASAFVLLVVLAALSAALALLQDSLAVALLGVTGGFLAPFLASTGKGDHVALFSYFAVLNLVIFGMAWFRSWRSLNVVGFLFTFVLSAVWGVLQYRAQDFASTEPFLVVFFLLYVAIAVLFSTRERSARTGYLDGTIVFGTPIAAFGLQAAMLHHQPLLLAYSALAVSALYLALAWLLHRRRGEPQRLLVEAFMALGVAFVTLAVPLALDGRWSAASWALEGAALVWVGCRQQRRLPRLFGVLLELAAGGALAWTLRFATSVPSGTYIAAVMVGVASAYGAFVLYSARAQLSESERALSPLLFLWGLLWWCTGGVSELEQHVDKASVLAAVLLFATVTALLCSDLGRRFPIARAAALTLLPVMLLFAAWAASSLPHPLAHGGFISWPLAFAGLYAILWLHDGNVSRPLLTALHPLTLWLLAALASWELAWSLRQSVAFAWPVIAWAIVPVAILAALPRLTERVRWPFAAHRDVYRGAASSGIALYLALWSIIANVLVSNPSRPLPYLPLINPLDILQGLVLLALIRLWMRVRAERDPPFESSEERPAVIGLALLAFVWLNAVLLRTLHHWAGIPYELSAMLSSTLVESALSVFWAFLALATMLSATRLRLRVMWLTGAALLIAVVVKLFLVDLASIGTIERIVSFVGVGLLMLVLGYFSPLPPAAEESR